MRDRGRVLWAAIRPHQVRPVTEIERKRALRVGLLDLADSLVADYDWLPAGCVTAAIAVCHSELVGSGLEGPGLLDATEAMVRSRLCAHHDGTGRIGMGECRDKK